MQGNTSVWVIGSLLIDEREWSNGEVEDCSVIAGHLEVPLSTVQINLHIRCAVVTEGIECRWEWQLFVQAYFALLKDQPTFYVCVEIVNIIRTIVSILFLRRFVSPPISPRVINNQPVIFTSFVKAPKLNHAFKRPH